MLRSQVHVEGREVAAQALLLELFDPQSLVLRFAVDGTQAFGLTAGQRVQAQFANTPGSCAELTIARAWPALDPDSGRRLFEARLPAHSGFAVGQSARVSVEPVVAVQLPAPTQAIGLGQEALAQHPSP